MVAKAIPALPRSRFNRSDSPVRTRAAANSIVIPDGHWLILLAFMLSPFPFLIVVGFPIQVAIGNFERKGPRYGTRARSHDQRRVCRTGTAADPGGGARTEHVHRGGQGHLGRRAAWRHGGGGKSGADREDALRHHRQ